MDRCGNGQLDGTRKPESVDSSAAQGWRGPRMTHRRTGGAGWRPGEPVELLSEARVPWRASRHGPLAATKKGRCADRGWWLRFAAGV